MFLEINSAAFLPEWLTGPDRSLFTRINGQWNSRFLDAVLPFVREPMVWMPFYLFLVFFMVINFKGKGWLWVLFLILTASMTDYISSNLIKGAFFRLRPCRDPDLVHHIRFLVNYCPVSSSFVSSHAVNHFGVSTFIFVTFKNAISPKWILIYLWALMICYAQVYVGVHFPADVAAGAVIGIILGYIVSALYNRFFPLPVSY